MRLIDADAIRYIWANGTICVEPSTIKKMPTVDAVPVIRCKDCRFGHRSELVEEKIICKYGGYGKSSQDWCSWAERKGGDAQCSQTETPK